ncbi:protein transparent testa 12 [Phtheirospermum japonicum]|uniref:Protein transparent testa 12 n=1 Tax=Phtheirospermum japonicum TaxID=374723 RepID=A0A830B791_9LAMI|nr:protein transparent testa 12 [Phtheirospermum japonicum]
MPPPASKVTEIPIKSPLPETISTTVPLPQPRESSAAIKIQSAYRSHAIRALVRKISAADSHFFVSSFFIGDEDILPVISVAGFVSAFKNVSSKLWYLAGPAILTCIFQYSLCTITQTFSGHVGTLDLAAFSIQNSIIGSLSLGIMMGMGSTLETHAGVRCWADGNVGPSVDAARAVGRYFSTHWEVYDVDDPSAILRDQILGYSFLNIYLFTNVYVHIRGASVAAARAVGRYFLTHWEVHDVDDPSAVLRDQLSHRHVLASSEQDDGHGLDFCGGLGFASFVQLATHDETPLGACGKAWTGFSWKAFENLWGFVKLSVASAVILCLEIWYFTALILFAGYLKNAEVIVDALSIWPDRYVALFGGYVYDPSKWRSSVPVIEQLWAF